MPHLADGVAVDGDTLMLSKAEKNRDESHVAPIRNGRSARIQLASIVLRSIRLAFLFCPMLAILSSIPLTSKAASLVGVPGAWLGVALFGEGHDWEHMAGVLVGELLFFSLVFSLPQLVRWVYLRRAVGVSD